MQICNSILSLWETRNTFLLMRTSAARLSAMIRPRERLSFTHTHTNLKHYILFLIEIQENAILLEKAQLFFHILLLLSFRSFTPCIHASKIISICSYKQMCPHLLLEGSLCSSVWSSAPAEGFAPESVSSGPPVAPKRNTAELIFIWTLSPHYWLCFFVIFIHCQR